MRPLFVVVSGAPGSGKSTLARELAPRLGLPLFMKDTIKEAIADVIPAPDLVASKVLGAATMRVLLALARDNAGAVIESTWERSLAADELSALPSKVIEVFCDVPPDVAQQRYVARAGTRHLVHFDVEQGGDLQGWIDRHPQRVDGGWPLIAVDTTAPVDLDALVAKILAA
jgi:predicted kinase